jgi:hypothetical protein
VEEIRARRTAGTRIRLVDLDYLLAKLDDAEKSISWRGNAVTASDFEHYVTKLGEAEARERALIAGVKELDIALQRYAPNNAPGLQADLRAILSRLLPSTPTSAHPGHLGEIRARDARDVLGVKGEKGGWATGGFTTDLIRTIARADPENRGRLRQAFPGLVAAVEAYSNLDGGVEILQQIAAQPEHSGAVE